jgi:hypothetical protein
VRVFLELGPKYLISKSNCSIEVASNSVMVCLKIRVITKLPNSEQSSKGKVKTHKYIQTKSVNNRKTVKTVMKLSFQE